MNLVIHEETDSGKCYCVTSSFFRFSIKAVNYLRNSGNGSRAPVHNRK